MISEFFQFLMHLDVNLLLLVQSYGIIIYPLLFIVLFCETGLVVAPFLPGDSLLFAAGTLAAVGALNLWIVLFILLFAAIIGDSVNYSIGKFAGRKLIEKNYIKEAYIQKTEHFYEKYGNKTIVIARFMPIIRTFAPFIAGVGRMNYTKFLFYNILGAVMWVLLFVLGGFFFGNIPLIKEHFSLVILLIIIISIVPAVIDFVRYKFSKN
ncbi:SNARE associated Golgi protein [uncultured archaeon]|nr:SNARE associated Golgi protein [uncultured archaeon]